MTSHLPSLGALAVAVVIAAVAYSVYDSSQSSGPDGASHATRDAGLVEPGSANEPAPVKPQSARHSKGQRHAAAHGGGRGGAPSSDGTGMAPALLSGVSPTLLSEGAPRAGGGPVLQPVASEPPAGAPHSRPKPEGRSRLDRELQHVIDGPGQPKPKPAPRSPKPVAPPPAPKPKTPVSGPTSPAPAQPAAPGATPADPDAGLDDLPVGGLDPTDLGEPVDETDTGATPAPPATPPATPPADPGTTPTDPDAGLDDTPAGGLDQTDPAQPVDTTATAPAGG
jgi:hypothetical protein